MHTVWKVPKDQYAVGIRSPGDTFSGSGNHIVERFTYPSDAYLFASFLNGNPIPELSNKSSLIDFLKEKRAP